MTNVTTDIAFVSGVSRSQVELLLPNGTGPFSVTVIVAPTEPGATFLASSGGPPTAVCLSSNMDRCPRSGANADYASRTARQRVENGSVREPCWLTAHLSVLRRAKRAQLSS